MSISTNPLLIWLLVYVIPLALAGAFAVFVPLNTKTRDDWVKLNTLVIHMALVISIAFSQYIIYSFGLEFPWEINLPSIIILLASVAVALSLVGSFGILYSVSAFIQEVMMLSVAYLLLPTFPVWAVILLIVPIFAVCHLLSLDRWKLRLVLVTIWGCASVLIFYLTYNLYIVVALHTVLGAFFAKSIMFLWLKPSVQRN